MDARSSPVVIALDLPIPPSVNQIRRINRNGDKARQKFYLHSDLHISAFGPKPAPVRKITGRYLIEIKVPECSRLDLDNHIKSLLDYLVSREFVAGDDKRYLRRLTIEWVDTSSSIWGFTRLLNGPPCCHVTITETT